MAMNDRKKAAADVHSSKRGIATVLKDIGLFLASPFIAMAYMALFPFIALVFLVRTGNLEGRPRTAPKR